MLLIVAFSGCQTTKPFRGDRICDMAGGENSKDSPAYAPEDCGELNAQTDTRQKSFVPLSQAKSQAKPEDDEIIAPLERDSFVDVIAQRPSPTPSPPVGQAALDPKASLGDIAIYLKTKSEEVNWEKIWPSDVRVLFIGESHPVISHKDEIIKQMQEFKKTGMTHLAFEFVLENDQQIIDDYYANKVPRAKVLGVLLHQDDKIKDKYMQMIDAAKSNGIKILALDIYDKRVNTNPLMPPGDMRNPNWARIISQITNEDQKTRVLAYGGRGHFGYDKIGSTANQIFGRMSPSSVKSKVVSFTGGEKQTGLPEIFPSFAEKISYVSQNNGMGGKKFGISVNSNTMPRPGDYIIHLPQTED